MIHIASAVVKARPVVQDAVAERIANFAGADVVAVDNGRIIVVFEASQQCDLGDALDRIATLDGVLSATLVFEHSEPDGDDA